MAYGKIFESMYTGSLVGAGPVVLSLWPYIIANAKPPGFVELNPKILATIIGTSVEAIAEAIHFLCQPDEHSRTHGDDGRRLIPEGPFLYRVVTWEKYNKIRNDIERREQNRVAQRNYRARRRGTNVTASSADMLTVSECQQSKPMQMQTQMQMQMETQTDQYHPSSGTSDQYREPRPDSGELRSDSGGSGLSGSGSGSAIRSLMEVGFGGKNFGQVVEFAKQLAQMGLDDADVRDLCKAASKGKNPAGLLQSWVRRGDTEKVLARARA